MRFLTPILCLLLAATAAGRYHAEAEVRAAREALDDTREALVAEEAEEQRLRLEVEVLESATRLSDLNAQTTRLSPARPDQMTTRSDFAEVIGRPLQEERALPEHSDVIGNAITMTDPAAAAGGAQ